MAATQRVKIFSGWDSRLVVGGFTLWSKLLVVGKVEEEEVAAAVVVVVVAGRKRLEAKNKK